MIFYRNMAIFLLILYGGNLRVVKRSEKAMLSEIEDNLPTLWEADALKTVDPGMNC